METTNHVEVAAGSPIQAMTRTIEWLYDNHPTYVGKIIIELGVEGEGIWYADIDYSSAPIPSETPDGWNSPKNVPQGSSDYFSKDSRLSYRFRNVKVLLRGGTVKIGFALNTSWHVFVDEPPERDSESGNDYTSQDVIGWKELD